MADPRADKLTASTPTKEDLQFTEKAARVDTLESEPRDPPGSGSPEVASEAGGKGGKGNGKCSVSEMSEVVVELNNRRATMDDFDRERLCCPDTIGKLSIKGTGDFKLGKGKETDADMFSAIVADSTLEHGLPLTLFVYGFKLSQLKHVTALNTAKIVFIGVQSLPKLKGVTADGDQAEVRFPDLAEAPCLEEVTATGQFATVRFEGKLLHRSKGHGARIDNSGINQNTTRMA